MQTEIFHDFDAFAESVKHVESKMLLRQPKDRIWRISSVNLPGIDIQFGQLGSGNIAQAGLEFEGYLLYLPLTDAVEYTANGVVIKNKSFAILEPGCEFCMSTKEAHDWCVAFVPSHLLASGSEGAEPLSDSKGNTCRVTRPNRLAADRFQSLVEQIMAAASYSSQFESTNAASRAETEVLKVVSSVLGQPQYVEPHRKGRAKIPRQQIIRHSNELFEERQGEHVYLEELARAAQVSQRTLRTAFNEYYGVGPLHYLQLRKLNQVHCALKASDLNADSVSKILMAHGEWDFSRFASRYRQLFGELPSETLRRNRQ